MYSLVSASVLALDLARHPSGAAVADAVDRVLALTPDDVAALAACADRSGETGAARAALHAACADAPRMSTLMRGVSATVAQGLPGPADARVLVQALHRDAARRARRPAGPAAPRGAAVRARSAGGGGPGGSRRRRRRLGRTHARRRPVGARPAARALGGRALARPVSAPRAGVRRGGRGAARPARPGGPRRRRLLGPGRAGALGTAGGPALVDGDARGVPGGVRVRPARAGGAGPAGGSPRLPARRRLHGRRARRRP